MCTLVVVEVIHIKLERMDCRNANVCCNGSVCESDGGSGSGCGCSVGRDIRGFAFNSVKILWWLW